MVLTHIPLTGIMEQQPNANMEFLQALIVLPLQMLMAVLLLVVLQLTSLLLLLPVVQAMWRNAAKYQVRFALMLLGVLLNININGH